MPRTYTFTTPSRAARTCREVLVWGARRDIFRSVSVSSIFIYLLFSNRCARSIAALGLPGGCVSFSLFLSVRFHNALRLQPRHVALTNQLKRLQQWLEAEPVPTQLDPIHVNVRRAAEIEHRARTVWATAHDASERGAADIIPSSRPGLYLNLFQGAALVAHAPIDSCFQVLLVAVPLCIDTELCGMHRWAVPPAIGHSLAPRTNPRG